MNVLVLLIPVSLFLGLLGLISFVWTIRARQYEDPFGQASRILLEPDGEQTAAPKKTTKPDA
ncbi:MAG: cbb3-type cytochrome oxidase assembly protein CcoS [Pseudomonadota bacterium]